MSREGFLLLLVIVGGLMESKQQTTYCEEIVIKFPLSKFEISRPHQTSTSTCSNNTGTDGHHYCRAGSNCSLWGYYCNRGNVCQYGSECVKSSVSNNVTMLCGLIPDHDDVSKHGTTLKLWTSEREPILNVNNNTHNEHEF